MPLDPLLAELEQNIAEDLSVERLAGAGLFSRSQLYREFYSATGHSVKEYVRRRRLSRALALVKHTDMPLEQIAQECGFGSPQALCKSVKAAIGQTPMQYKAGGAEYYFPALEDRGWQQPVTVSSETIPPTLCLRYYDSRLPGLEDRALAWFFAERPGYNGRIFGRNGKQEGAKLCYELYIEAENADRPAFSGTTAAATFAITSCPNAEREISAAWDYLYNDWLKTSMYTMAEHPWPYFEEYIHVNGQIKRLQLYLPVVKRPGFHRIQLCRCNDMQFLAARRSCADAEKAASKAVMEFLAAHYPRLARSARQFYVSSVPEFGPGLRVAGSKLYVCGVALQAPLNLSPGRNAAAAEVEIITRPAGEYAVLEGDCCGDTGAYEAVLASWARGMGLNVEKPPFAVYEAGGSYDRQDIRVKIYLPIEK